MVQRGSDPSWGTVVVFDGEGFSGEGFSGRGAGVDGPGGARWYAEENGWDVVPVHHGHVWGRMTCPADEQPCELRIYSTPKNPGNEAKRLRRFVDRCEHQEKD